MEHSAWGGTVTNREIAAKLAIGIANSASVPQDIDAIESALDAAERRGRIAILEAVITGELSLLKFTEELARLRAEEGNNR